MRQNHTGYMALNYDSFFGRGFEDLPLILNLTERAESIIEFAVGTGRIAIPLAKRGQMVFGVDASDDMLRVAKKKCADEHVRMPLILGDMRKADLKARAEWVVCGCRSFLHNLTEDDQLSSLRTFEKHLAPGGRIFLDGWYMSEEKVRQIEKTSAKVYHYTGSDGNPWSVEILYQKIDRSNQVIELVFCHRVNNEVLDQNECYFRWIAPAEMDHLALQAGLVVDQCLDGYTNREFSGAESIVWTLKRRSVASYSHL